MRSPDPLLSGAEGPSGAKFPDVKGILDPSIGVLVEQAFRLLGSRQGIWF